MCEKRLKLVTVKRSERTSQSFTSVCYQVWVSEVNVHHFFWVHVHFDGRYRPSTDFFWYEGIDSRYRSIFFWYESISTVDFDQFWVKSTVDQILTVFSSRWILIDRRYRPYSQVGESLSTVDIDRDWSTGRLKSNRPIDDICGLEHLLKTWEPAKGGNWI